MNGFSLTGQRVAVIGGGSGVGFAIAQLAHQQGAQVAIASSNPARVEAAAARLPGAAADTVDVRDEDSVAAFFNRLGAFDHLAITAGDWGGSMFQATAEIDLAAARERLSVRVWGALCAVKHSIGKIAAEGSITLTSGMLSHRPRKGGVLAAMSGAAVENMARGLAVDLAPIRVNAVCLGLILTEIVSQMPEQALKGYVSGLPLPRAATPAEAAAAYVYAMLNSYVTGQIIPVDGGASLV